MQKLIYITVLFNMILSCSSPKGENAPVQETIIDQNKVTLTVAQIRSAGLQTDTVEVKEISSHLRVAGKVDVPPQNMVSVSFPLGGYLKSTELLPGVYVRRGAVLGVLEDIQFIQMQQDYLTAKSRMDFLQSDYLRQQQLNASKASSDKAFQQASSEYKSQQIQVSALEQKLSLIGLNPAKLSATNISKKVNIYSPISGYVTKVNVNIGKYVSPTDVLFELVNPSDIHLVLTVFQKDIEDLKIGQKVLTFTNSDSARKIPATILLISQDIAADGTTEVHCHFDETTHMLIPGMFMNATINIRNRKSVTLPEAAVVSYQNKHYVFQATGDSTFNMVEVETGETEDGSVSLLKPAEAEFRKGRFVVQNAYSLLMAMKNKSDDE